MTTHSRQEELVWQYVFALRAWQVEPDAAVALLGKRTYCDAFVSVVVAIWGDAPTSQESDAAFAEAERREGARTRV